MKNLRPKNANLHKDIASSVFKCVSLDGKKLRNIFCLGCGVKVPLRTVVYPCLRKIKKTYAKTNIKMDIGNDAYIFETDGKARLNRRLYPNSLLKNNAFSQAGKDIQKLKPRGVVLLSSYTEPASSRTFFSSLLSFCAALTKLKYPFYIGKGHSIQISKVPEQEFLMADYIASKSGKYYGVANNDTIVTLDFNLKHSSPLNVYISLNNALNDLYVHGVYKDITLYPVYDSIDPKDNGLIKKSIKNYVRNFKKYNYKVVDFGPLGLNLEAIGSSVVGISDRELPRLSGLVPGQILLVTRPIGDLAALVLYIIGQTKGNLSARIRDLKINVLSKIATSNVEIGKMIYDYLPRKGENFDIKRHITATKDITGEGISVFEDMALQSKTNIYIEQIKLHSRESSYLNVPNNTSNTNGAIIMAVHPKLSGQIIKRLKDIGCKPWIAGRVGSRSNTPSILLSNKLKKYPFIKQRSIELFNRYRFVCNGK